MEKTNKRSGGSTVFDKAFYSGEVKQYQNMYEERNTLYWSVALLWYKVPFPYKNHCLLIFKRTACLTIR